MADLIIKNNGNVTWNDFMVEAYTKSPELVGMYEDGNYYTKFSSTPVVENSGGFLINVRDGDTGAFARCQTTKNMGNYDSIFKSPSKNAEYCEIWDYETPIDYIDDEGNPQSYYLSPKYCVFAGDPPMDASMMATIEANRGN